MIEAVRTTASTGVIWGIVVVMSLFTAFLVAATQVADRVQSRQDQRRRMMLRASGAAGLPSQRTSQDGLTGPDGSRAPEAVPAGMTSTGARRMDPANPVPGQRRDTARQAGHDTRESATQDAAEAPTEPIPASAGTTTARRPGSVPQQGPVPEPGPMAEQDSMAEPGPRAAQGPAAEQGPVPQQGSRTEQEPMAEQGSRAEQGPRAEQGGVPQQGSRAEQGPVPEPGPMPETAGARGRHAQGNSEAAGDEAPAGGPGQAGDPGRHAMPAQRSGESDRAGRSFAGPANPDPDESDQD